MYFRPRFRMLFIYNSKEDGETSSKILAAIQRTPCVTRLTTPMLSTIVLLRTVHSFPCPRNRSAITDPITEYKGY